MFLKSPAKGALKRPLHEDFVKHGQLNVEQRLLSPRKAPVHRVNHRDNIRATAPSDLNLDDLEVYVRRLEAMKV